MNRKRDDALRAALKRMSAEDRSRAFVALTHRLAGLHWQFRGERGLGWKDALKRARGLPCRLRVKT